jgi:hypothetical protein
MNNFNWAVFCRWSLLKVSSELQPRERERQRGINTLSDCTPQHMHITPQGLLQFQSHVASLLQMSRHQTCVHAMSLCSLQICISAVWCIVGGDGARGVCPRSRTFFFAWREKGSCCYATLVFAPDGRINHQAADRGQCRLVPHQMTPLSRPKSGPIPSAPINWSAT